MFCNVPDHTKLLRIISLSSFNMTEKLIENCIYPTWF